MAVIITDMDMPKGCWYETDKKLSGVTTCPLIGRCRNKHYNVDKLNERPSDCPLKSLDDILTSIENLKIYGNPRDIKYFKEGLRKATEMIRTYTEL